MDRLLDRDERGKISQEGIYESKVPFMILVCEAQDAKTLRAVGEWILDKYEPGDDCQCIMFVNNLVNALREGKMPE